jgi:hypothetical protein
MDKSDSDSDSELEPMSEVRKQYTAFRTPARDDGVWQECPVIGLMVASSFSPDVIEETERDIEMLRTTSQPTGGGIFDSFYFAKHPDVVEYVRPRSPGEFGAREEEIPPRFQYIRVTNLTRLVSQSAEGSSDEVKLAELALRMEVHRRAPVAFRVSRMAP